MKSTLISLAAVLASALALPTDLALTPRDSSDCTTYCSVSAGCVCRSYPADCTASYLVESGDTCLTIAKSFGNFTVTQLYEWNPDMGRTCAGLRAFVPVCINTPDYQFVPPVQPPFGTHETPDQIPVPIMPNIIDSCETFELVEPGKRVEDLAEENGFAVEQFAEWNGNSTTAWAAYWACVKA